MLDVVKAFPKAERNVSTEYVLVQDTSGRRVYNCADMDDFDNDVEKARLNQWSFWTGANMEPLDGLRLALEWI